MLFSVLFLWWNIPISVLRSCYSTQKALCKRSALLERGASVVPVYSSLWESVVRCVWEPVGQTTLGSGLVTACRTAPGPAGMDVLLRACSDGEREKQNGRNRRRRNSNKTTTMHLSVLTLLCGVSCNFFRDADRCSEPDSPNSQVSIASFHWMAERVWGHGNLIAPPPASVEVLHLNPPLQCLSLMLALSLATPLWGKSYRSLLPHPSVDISLPPAGLKEGTLGAV